MRVLVAARLSRLISGGAQTGIDSQDAEVAAWAEREGHEIVHVAADFKTGTSNPWDRKNLRPWVTEPSKLVLYDAVVALSLDRLSRGDKQSTNRIEAWAHDNKKEILTRDGFRFPSEGADGIAWDVQARLAHAEWLKISERYKRMTGFLRDGGYHVGRAPFGYQSVPLGNHKGLAIVPSEAKLIRDACDWYLAGLSLADISTRLNQAGRLPRKMKDGHQPLWVGSTISKVLHNEVIAGRQKHKGGKGATILKVEPIVSREVWEGMIQKMAVKAKRSGISQTKTPALLTSIIVCTTCSRSMYRTGLNYYCHTKGCQSIIRLEAADAEIHAAMSTDDRRDIVETVVPGTGHDAEIAEIKQDMSEAVTAEDFDRLGTLRIELARLRALPATATRIQRCESSQTVAEMWAAMPDDVARRAYLLERGARVLFSPDGMMINLKQSQTI